METTSIAFTGYHGKVGGNQIITMRKGCVKKKIETTCEAARKKTRGYTFELGGRSTNQETTAVDNKIVINMSLAKLIKSEDTVLRKRLMFIDGIITSDAAVSEKGKESRSDMRKKQCGIGIRQTRGMEPSSWTAPNATTKLKTSSKKGTSNYYSRTQRSLIR